MKTKKITFLFGAVGVSVVGCTTMNTDTNRLFPTAEEAVKNSWHNVSPEWQSRLVQDETQKICSAAKDKLAKSEAAKVERINQSLKVIYPASGKLVGDWKNGEAVAQSGFGHRVGDDVTKPNGGNCYACHALQKKEVSYGTLGPSLTGYGKLRGNSEAIVKYTYDKIYNAQAFSACSNMPRFGHNGILKPEQIADLVALLVDPQSPVNQ